MSTTYAPKDFQIGSICALPIEAAAAALMLDEKFGILEEQDSADTNTYTLGRVGRHYVVIACLPDGHYGTTSATTVANNMMRTFSKSLRIGLMVGIGSGIPSSSHDIRLGDIVISRPEGTSEGIIQYDMGKILHGGEFCRTGYLKDPPKPLLTALSQMKATGLYEKPRYPSYVQQAIKRNEKTQENFSRPNLKTDRLFRVEYGHPAGAATCDKCLEEWEESRIPHTKWEPKPHYGIIASGNTVVKDGITREKIHKEINALCFVMEAAGLMADFPCIVIRGICDYSDSHKYKKWQGYAALTAAAYAKELLSYIPRAEVSKEKLATEICVQLKDIKERLDKEFDQRERHHQELVPRAVTEEQHNCHQTFKTSTYEQYKNNNQSRAEGTCEWVLKSSEYRRWQESRCNDLLWVSADPGCGKSVLAKSLIDESFGNFAPNISICYFFFKDNDEQNQLATALCAVLHQLFGTQPDLLNHALPSWKKNKDKLQQEVHELWRILMAVASDPIFNNTICIFDALDECRRQDQKILIEKMREFHNESDPSSSVQKSWLKFFVTSRPYDEIKKDFLPLIKYFSQIHLHGEEENEKINKEINLVVKQKVEDLCDSLGLKSETKARLEKQFLEMNHRTYLWLYLAIEDIRVLLEDSDRPDDEDIPLVPDSVNEAYRRILDRVANKHISRVKMILQIIVGARRPLTIQEMASALGVAKSPEARTLEQAVLNPKRLGENIRRHCGLFVFISGSRIYLIHQTAREFLTTIGDISKPEPYNWHFTSSAMDITMTRICVKYLLLLDDLMDSIKRKNSTNTRDNMDGKDALSFLFYSKKHWPNHYRDIPSLSKSEVTELVFQLYDVTREIYQFWFPMYWNSKAHFGFIPEMTAIKLAAFNGQVDIIRMLAKDDKNAINLREDKETSALQLASMKGHVEAVQILLENGADINAQELHESALQEASSNGHIEIVQMLLENGADINAQNETYVNALQAASSNGHIEIVQILLENGAEINTQSGSYAL